MPSRDIMADTWIVVPARGGSKGIRGKNLRPLAGRPLILHVLDEMACIVPRERLVVTTDDSIRTSARNRLCGTVVRCQEGAINGEVVIELPGGTGVAIDVATADRDQAIAAARSVLVRVLASIHGARSCRLASRRRAAVSELRYSRPPGCARIVAPAALNACRP